MNVHSLRSRDHRCSQNSRRYQRSKNGVDVTRSEVTRYRTSYLSTPTLEMHAESVLRAGEELKVLMSSLRLNPRRICVLRLIAH